MAMKMLKMRLRGVEIPKRSLNDRFNQSRGGTLEIKDTTAQGLHRKARIAHFKHATRMDILYDPTILWWSGGRFVLSGFERLKNDQLETVDFAQSWLCFEGIDPLATPEGR